jgi:hypothetical protein
MSSPSRFKHMYTSKSLSCAASLLCSSVLLAQPAAQPQDPLTLKGKTDYFLRTTFDPNTLGRVGMLASLGHIGGVSEDEWGTGSAAYGRRLGSRYTDHLVSRTVRFGIGAIRREDPRFYRSDKAGFLPRTKFVLSRTFLVKMDNGSTSVAVGRLVGRFAGDVTAVYLRQTPMDPLRTSLTNSAIGLGGDIGVRMIAEFWPDIKRVFRR